MRACELPLLIEGHSRLCIPAPRVGSANTARHAPTTRSAASCCSRAQGGLSGSAVSMGPQRRRPVCRWRGRPPRSDGASTRRAFQPSATTRTASHTADATLNVNTASVAAVDAAVVAASATLSITLTVATTASSDRLLVLPACVARARGTVAAAAMDGAGRAARRRGRGIPRAGLPLGRRGGPCATPRARTDGAGRGAAAATAATPAAAAAATIRHDGARRVGPARSRDRCGARSHRAACGQPDRHPAARARRDAARHGLPPMGRGAHRLARRP